YPGGGVVEVARDGKVLFEFKGTQSEVNTSQKLSSGNILLTEAGPKPRILEIDPQGKTIIEVALKCQTTNFHMQSRMTRKLPNDNTVIASYGIGAHRTKLIEVTKDKRVVWTYADDRPHGIHHFQILTTNGKPLEGNPPR